MCECDTCLFKNLGFTKTRFPQVVEEYGRLAFTPSKGANDVQIETPRFWRCGCRNHIIPRGEPGNVIINLETKERTIVLHVNPVVSASPSTGVEVADAVRIFSTSANS